MWSAAALACGGATGSNSWRTPVPAISSTYRPYVPHQEINASDDEPLSCVIVRSGQEAVVVNLDLPSVEPNPQPVEWVDDLHPPRRG